MKRILSFLVLALTFASTPLIAESVAAKSPSSTYRSCKEANKRYPFGIALNKLKVGTSKATPLTSVYKANKKLDFDNDGVICENEALQVVPLNAPITNLQEFIDKYAQSVVTVSCESSQGSGVSLPVAGWSTFETQIGAQSRIITNHHVVFDCINSFTDVTQNKMTILFRGVEYVGYVTTAPSWVDVNENGVADLAGISTTALIPVTPALRTVPNPRLGDVVVAVGSSGGSPNITTKGDVAGLTSTDLIITAPAGHGSSGGGVFNTRGQLLGFIYAVNGNLTQAVPIPRICEVFECGTPITYLP